MGGEGTAPLTGPSRAEACPFENLQGLKYETRILHTFVSLCCRWHSTVAAAGDVVHRDSC